MKKTALIMAGGRGERFWPRSRQSLPKQFLSLTDDKKTMLQLTVERILPLVAMEDIFIVTNRGYRELVRAQLPELPEGNILCEPVGKNTAPCIGLGAVHIAKKYGDAVMMVLPSDHLIKYTSLFLNTLTDACEVAEQGGNLVTLGIAPDCPETGYGYIKFQPEQTLGRAFAVEKFVEKPDLETAKAYLASEQYLWNSGMFIWKTSTILDNLQAHLPETYAGLCKIREAIGTPVEEQVLEREFQGKEHLYPQRGIWLGRRGFLAGGQPDQAEQRAGECGRGERGDGGHPGHHYPGRREADRSRGPGGHDRGGLGGRAAHLREGPRRRHQEGAGKPQDLQQAGVFMRETFFFLKEKESKRTENIRYRSLCNFL